MAARLPRQANTLVNDTLNKYSGEQDRGANSIAYADALMQCFGPHPHGHPTDPVAARRPYEAYFLPDAYKGRSDYLLTTIIDAVISGNSFITGKCLPLLQHDNPEITWSTMSFDNTFVDYEPEQGVPRLLTQRSATFQDHMARRGIAFVVNHGFANTEGGRLDFFYKLAHMKHVLQETLDQDGLLQIVNCKNDYPHVSNGFKDAFERKDGDGMRACEKTLENFACVQKGTGRGWVTLDESIKAEMARNGVQPDTWIVPPGMKSFAALEEASVEYYRAGPISSKNIERGGKQNDIFRGNEVFTCNSYRLDNAEVDINPFVRDRVLGDYFVVRNWGHGRVAMPDNGRVAMPDNAHDRTGVMNNADLSVDGEEAGDTPLVDSRRVPGRGTTDAPGDDVEDIQRTGVSNDPPPHSYAPSEAQRNWEEMSRKTHVYCCETDKWEVFDLEEVAKTYWKTIVSTGFAQTACDEREFGDDATKINKLLSKGTPIHEFVQACTGHTYTRNGGNPSELGERSGPFDHKKQQFSFLCMRPFRRYRMGSAVLMATGLDTGFTAHAHEDVQVGDDPISHVHVTHFTGWFSSTIIDTKRVAVAHDVFCMGYQTGEGKKLVDCDKFRDMHPYQYMFESSGDKGSVFAMLAPKDFGKPGAAEEHVPKNPIDISGSGTAVPCGGDHNMPWSKFNNSIWRFTNWVQGAATGSDLVNEASRFSADPHVNMLCFQTMQKVISSNGSNDYEFGAYIRNTDHFGADHIGPGSRSSRNGGFAALKHFNYDSLKIL